MDVRFQKVASDRTYEEYIAKRKELKRAIRNAKLLSWIKGIPKAFYTHVKYKEVTWEKVGLFKDKGGNLCLELEDVVEETNQYFAFVFT